MSHAAELVDLGAWAILWIAVIALAVKLYLYLLFGDRKPEDVDENGFTSHDWQCILPIIRAKQDGQMMRHSIELNHKMKMRQTGEDVIIDWSRYLEPDRDVVAETVAEWKVTKQQINRRTP